MAAPGLFLLPLHRHITVDNGAQCQYHLITRMRIVSTALYNYTDTILLHKKYRRLQNYMYFTFFKLSLGDVAGTQPPTDRQGEIR